MSAPAYVVVRGQLVRMVERNEDDSFPSVEEMVRVLYARPFGEMEHAKLRLLNAFLVEWSRYSGEPLGVAKRRADALVQEVEGVESRDESGCELTPREVYGVGR